MSIIRTNFRFLFPIATFSNFIALLVGLGITVIFRLFQIRNVEIILSVLMATSFLVQTYFFKVKKLTESQFVDSKWLKKNHKMTANQLDQYSSFNYIGYSLMKIIVVVTTITGNEAHTSLSVAFLLFLGFIVLKQALSSAKMIKLPSALFKKGVWTSHLRFVHRCGIDYSRQLGTGLTFLRSR